MYIRELVEKMSKLEIDPNFKENPAYEATLEEINSLRKEISALKKELADIRKDGK